MEHVLVQAYALDVGFLFQQLVKAARDAEDEPSAVAVQLALERIEADGRSVVHRFRLGKRRCLFGAQRFRLAGIDRGEAFFDLSGRESCFHDNSSCVHVIPHTVSRIKKICNKEMM